MRTCQAVSEECMRFERKKLTAIDALNRMKEVFNVSSDTALSEKLNIPKQTVSSWKRRDSIPSKVIIDISSKVFCNIDYFIWEDAKKHNDDHGKVPENSYVACVALVLYSRVKDQIKFGDEVSTAFWWDEVFFRIIFYYEKEIKTIGEKYKMDEIDVARDIIVSLLNADQNDLVNLVSEQMIRHFAPYAIPPGGWKHTND